MAFKISKCISNSLKTIDYFSQPFSFKVNNKYRVKSLLGGILTILMIMIILFFAYIFGNDIFYKKKPNVLMNNIVLKEFPTINYTQSNTVFALRLEDYYGYPIKNYKNYINVSVYYSTNKFIDKGYQNHLQPIGLNDCKKNSNFIQFLDENDIEEYLCIPDYNIRIGGDWGHDFVNYLHIKVDICKNSTQPNISCEFFDQTSNYLFNFYVSDGLVNFLDIQNPISYKLTNFYTLLDPNLYKSSVIRYSQILVETDNGFFFKNINNSTGIYLDTINTDFSYRSTKPMAEYFFLLSNKKQTVIRSYIKLQEISAQLGGITQILIVIFSHLLRPLQKKQVKSKLINNLFQFSKHELGIKKPILINFNESSESNRIKIINQAEINIGSPQLCVSNERELVSTKNKAREEKIKIIIEEINNSRKFYYSKCEIILSTYLCRLIHSKKIKNKDFLNKKSSIYLNKFLNINNLLEKIYEIDILKFLLLSKEQILAFNFLEKPGIYIEENLFFSNFSRILEKMKIVDENSAKEIINYFLKFSDAKLKKQNSIDAKLFEILTTKLRTLILSLR